MRLSLPLTLPLKKCFQIVTLSLSFQAHADFDDVRKDLYYLRHLRIYSDYDFVGFLSRSDTPHSALKSKHLLKIT